MIPTTTEEATCESPFMMARITVGERFDASTELESVSHNELAEMMAGCFLSTGALGYIHLDTGEVRSVASRSRSSSVRPDGNGVVSIGANLLLDEAHISRWMSDENEEDGA